MRKVDVIINVVIIRRWSRLQMASAKLLPQFIRKKLLVGREDIYEYRGRLKDDIGCVEMNNLITLLSQVIE